MPAWLLPVAAAAIGAGASALGQHSANKQNQKIAREQMAFQERMSSSAYQRATTDMKAAGLNPMLAFSQGGASAPSGASSRSENVGAAAERGVSSATGALMAKKQMSLIEAQTAKAISESHTAHSDQVIRRTDERMATARMDLYFDSFTGKPKGALADLLQSEHVSKLANSASSVSDAQIRAFSIPEQKAISSLFEEFGSSGKGLEKLMPLLLQLLRR